MNGFRVMKSMVEIDLSFFSKKLNIEYRIRNKDSIFRFSFSD